MSKGVYICSFPRSGTHLCINTLSINYGLDWKDLKANHDWSKYFELTGAIKDYSGMIKVHAFSDLLQKLPFKKTVFVTRHPWDIVLSLYDYLQNDKFYSWNPDCPDMRGIGLERFLEDSFPAWHFTPWSKKANPQGSIFDYWSYWMEGAISVARHNSSCFVDYSELVEGEIEEVAEFIGALPVSEITIPDLKNSFSHLPNKGISGRWEMPAYKEQRDILSKDNKARKAKREYELFRENTASHKV